MGRLGCREARALRARGACARRRSRGPRGRPLAAARSGRRRRAKRAALDVVEKVFTVTRVSGVLPRLLLFQRQRARWHVAVDGHDRRGCGEGLMIGAQQQQPDAAGEGDATLPIKSRRRSSDCGERHDRDRSGPSRQRCLGSAHRRPRSLPADRTAPQRATDLTQVMFDT
jgi:hypothetical protein